MSAAAPAIAVTATETAAPVATPDAQVTPVDGQAKPSDGQVTPTDPAKLWTEPAPVEEPVAEPVTPDWFMKDKYKTIEDQAKARFDLEKLMGKNWGAPKDDYVVEGIEGITANDPLLEHLKPHLKELGLSQNGFASLVKSYQDANIAMAKKIEAEVAETLTKTEAMTVQAVDKWLQNSFSDADRKTIQSWIMSVDDFKILNSVRLMMPGNSSVPSSTGNNAVKFESTAEVTNEKTKYRTEVSQGLRVADKNHENQLQQRWRDAYQREDRNKK